MTPVMENAPVPSLVPLKVCPAPSSRVTETPERGLAEVSLTVPLTVTVVATGVMVTATLVTSVVCTGTDAVPSW